LVQPLTSLAPSVGYALNKLRRRRSFALAVSALQQIGRSMAIDERPVSNGEHYT
jgi:hypothetical protein